MKNILMSLVVVALVAVGPARAAQEPRPAQNPMAARTAMHQEAMKKLEFLMVEIIENKPPFALGNFPRTEVRFMCLSSEDPRLATQKSGLPG